MGLRVLKSPYSPANHHSNNQDTKCPLMSNNLLKKSARIVNSLGIVVHSFIFSNQRQSYKEESFNHATKMAGVLVHALKQKILKVIIAFALYSPIPLWTSIIQTPQTGISWPFDWSKNDLDHRWLAVALLLSKHRPQREALQSFAPFHPITNL